MYINECGSRDDPTVILLAPMMVSGSDLYNLMKPCFRRNYHIVAPDQGGHGQAGGYRSADEEYGLARFMRYGYDLIQNRLVPESRIKVENMRADVLFLAVKDDDCWPSDVAVPRMLSVLREAGYPYRVESYIYEKGSHALSDGLDEMRGFPKWALKHMIPAEKRWPGECEEARKDSFRRILLNGGEVDVLLRLEIVVEHARRAVYRVQDVAHGYRLVSLL